MSSLRAPELLLRPARPTDEPLLVALAGDGLPGSVAALQWRASERAWASPSLRRSVVEVDGVACGRAYLAWSADEVRVVDVTLLPEHRGAGVGTALLREVLAEAGARVVVLHVAAGSPAMRLYGRLGFEEAGATDGVRVRMEHRP